MVSGRFSGTTLYEPPHKKGWNFQPGLTQIILYSNSRRLGALNFGFKKVNCTFRIVKNKLRGADRQCSHCTADLAFVLAKGQNPFFVMTRLNFLVLYHFISL